MTVDNLRLFPIPTLFSFWFPFPLGKGLGVRLLILDHSATCGNCAVGCIAACTGSIRTNSTWRSLKS